MTELYLRPRLLISMLFFLLEVSCCLPISIMLSRDVLYNETLSVRVYQIIWYILNVCVLIYSQDVYLFTIGMNMVYGIICWLHYRWWIMVLFAEISWRMKKKKAAMIELFRASIVVFLGQVCYIMKVWFLQILIILSVNFSCFFLLTTESVYWHFLKFRGTTYCWSQWNCLIFIGIFNYPVNLSCLKQIYLSHSY